MGVVRTVIALAAWLGLLLAPRPALAQDVDLAFCDELVELGLGDAEAGGLGGLGQELALDQRVEGALAHTPGALQAGASADISQSGALSGRIVADIRTPSQSLRATLLLGGTVKEPRVRN